MDSDLDTPFMKLCCPLSSTLHPICYNETVSLLTITWYRLEYDLLWKEFLEVLAPLKSFKIRTDCLIGGEHPITGSVQAETRWPSAKNAVDRIPVLDGIQYSLKSPPRLRCCGCIKSGFCKVVMVHIMEAHSSLPAFLLVVSSLPSAIWKCAFSQVTAILMPSDPFIAIVTEVCDD